MNSILKCIAVDDEPLALGLVTSFIKQTPFLELVDEFDNAIDALRAIHSQALDLVFLDIQMSDLTGIELARVLEGTPRENRPMIVFTTAYDQFALEGYKVDAIDYLLKPFNYQEFLRAASKAKSISDMRSTPVVREAETDFIFLKVEYQLIKVMHRDILYIEGLKDYVKVHVQNRERPILTLTSLKSLEEKLPAHLFMRIHRSYIVSLARIEAITKTSIQINKTVLTISENYRDRFHQAIKSGL